MTEIWIGSKDILAEKLSYQVKSYVKWNSNL